MISTRYESDGIPAFPLSPVQIQGLELHRTKLESGHYTLERVRCPVCRSENATVLARKDRYGIPLSVAACEECGLIRSDPRMDQRSYAEFYQEEYRQLYSGKEAADDEFFMEQYAHGRDIVNLLKAAGACPGRGELVIEVGCGAGGILAAFRDLGCDVLGCDLGEEFLRYGRLHRGLDLRVGGLADLQPSRPVALLIYSHVLEHVLDVQNELARARGLLGCKGVLYIEVPSVKNIHHEGYRGDFLRLLQNAHVWHFTATSLKNLMSVHGFRPLFCNEGVRSAFHLGGYEGWTSDYDEVISFLRKAERSRPWYRLRPTIIWRTVKARVPLAIRTHIKCWLRR